MGRIHTTSLLALAGSVSLLASTPTVSQAPAQLVIDAAVVDRDGAPVMDLKQEEIEIWVGGYRVPIQTFLAVTPASEDRAGRLMVMLLDDMVLPQQVIPRARDVARRLVNRMVPGDQMAILTLNGDRMESTNDQAKLIRRVDAWHNRASGVQPIDAIGAHVFETVTAISRGLAEAPGGRKTILAIGAAWLFDRPIPIPTTGARDLRPEWTAAMRAASLANASLYVLDPSGVGGTPVTGGESGFAAYTGGHTFLNTNDLSAAADRIMAEASNYYLLGIADPPIQRKAELRELEVKVARRGMTVRARKAIHGTEFTGRR